MTTENKTLSDLQYLEFNRLRNELNAIVHHACKYCYHESELNKEIQEHKKKSQSPWTIGLLIASLVLDYFLRPASGWFEFNFEFNLGTLLFLYFALLLISHQISISLLEHKKSAVNYRLDDLEYKWMAIGSLPSFKSLKDLIDENGDLKEAYWEANTVWLEEIMGSFTENPWQAQPE